MNSNTRRPGDRYKEARSGAGLYIYAKIKYKELENQYQEVLAMWAYESVSYQIYPLGFCGAPFENDGVAAVKKLS